MGNRESATVDSWHAALKVIDRELSATFVQHGFVRVERLIDFDATAALRGRITAIAGAAAVDEAPGSFAEGLRASAAGVRVFWDPALPGVAQAAPGERWHHAGRAGHALHLVDREVAQVLTRPRVLDAVRGVMPGELELLTSVFISKHPRGSVQFGPHQDTWYLHAQPERIVSLLIALDDTNPANGCLCVAPGSHRLPTRVRAIPGERDWFEQLLNDYPLPTCALELPMSAGDALLYDGRLYHASELNRSSSVRRVLIAQYAARGIEWRDTNWLRAPEGGFLRV